MINKTIQQFNKIINNNLNQFQEKILIFQHLKNQNNPKNPKNQCNKMKFLTQIDSEIID